MTPPLSANATLSPETLSGLSQVDERLQFDFFREHSGEPLLDAWLLLQMEPPNAKAQAMLRLARQAQSYWEGTDGRQHLLFGIPLVLQDTPKAHSWAGLHHEVESTLASALLPLTAAVALCRQPLPVSVLQGVGATQLGEWSEALFHDRDPAQGMYEAAGSGAYIWVGQVSVPDVQRPDIEALFFKMNADMTKRMRPHTVRLEAVAESRGVRLRLFPPTALWNSMSLARLVHARMQLEPFRKRPGLVTARREGNEVVVSINDAQVLRLDFPEELDEDVAPLFKGWADFKF